MADAVIDSPLRIHTPTSILIVTPRASDACGNDRYNVIVGTVSEIGNTSTSCLAIFIRNKAHL